MGGLCACIWRVLGRYPTMALKAESLVSCHITKTDLEGHDEKGRRNAFWYNADSSNMILGYRSACHDERG